MTVSFLGVLVPRPLSAVPMKHRSSCFPPFTVKIQQRQERRQGFICLVADKFSFETLWLLLMLAQHPKYQVCFSGNWAQNGNRFYFFFWSGPWIVSIQGWGGVLSHIGNMGTCREERVSCFSLTALNKVYNSFKTALKRAWTCLSQGMAAWFLFIQYSAIWYRRFLPIFGRSARLHHISFRTGQ